jgi:hypothetical protein
LSAFVMGFRDGHLNLGWNIGPQRLATPGFTVGLRGSDVVWRPHPSAEVRAAILRASFGPAPALGERRFGGDGEIADTAAVEKWIATLR